MEDNSSFVHLHCHTHHSLQDALPSPLSYATKLKEMGFKAGAITDHGKMSGVIDFVSSCKKVSTDDHVIKPIIGCEFYTYYDRFDHQQVVIDGKKRRPKHNHLTLLAKNDIGYRNLLKMINIGAEEGFYHEPTIDHDVLSRHSEGVIALSGCLGSELCQSILKEDMEGAKATAEWFKSIYQEDYYLEMHYHGIEEQKNTVIPALYQLSKELDIKTVAANDVHYLEQSDWRIHKLQISMSQQDKEEAESGKWKYYQSKNFFLKSYEQMKSIFGARIPEALTNTVELADKVENFFKLNVQHLLPKVNIPLDNPEFADFKSKYYKFRPDNEVYLAFLCFEGLRKFGLIKNKIYVDRLKQEIDTICYMGIVDYFLIEREMVEFMRGSNILYGIRGSGVASLVNFTLEICQVDPIKWNLMFERFLNPGRGEQYDINFKEYTINDWKASQEESEISDIDALSVIKSKLREVVDREQIEDVNGIKKELWVLENQNLAPYIYSAYKHGIKMPNNDLHLWSAYALGMTDKKPESSLIVKAASSLPDVDSDIEADRREDVIKWMYTRFGNQYCSKIGTCGTYKAKAAVTGSLKVSEKFRAAHADLTHLKAQEISKTIPAYKVNVTIEEAIEMSPDFAKYYRQWPTEIDLAKSIDGVIQNFGVHPSGILVASEPIYLHAPIERTKKGMASGYDMMNVEHVGLVKYDLLGSITYSMIRMCFELIKKRHGADKVPDIKKIITGQEDKKVINIFTEAKTNSVFQFSSYGMKQALKEVKVDSIENLIAINALYRPGPKDFIPQYAIGKKNPHSVQYSHPLIKEILGVTYGIPVYQEQAMQLSIQMAGFNWEEVDKLRKAVSKKMPAEFEKICKVFKEKSIKRGFSENVVDEVLTRLTGFAGYAFNRSHSCSYALLAYFTAYLRCYFPSEWLAACIHCEKDDENQIALYKEECKSENIKIIYPNVNQSGISIDVNDNGDILLPLTLIKGVGDSVSVISEHQPYENLKDMAFKSRANRRLVECLAQESALSCFPEIKKMSVAEIMEQWDGYVKERNIQDRVNRRLATDKFTVVKPVIKKITSDAKPSKDVDNNRQSVLKFRIKDDLFSEDLL